MKKIISIFLAAAMIICLMPASVMATDGSDASPCIVAKTVASKKNTLTVSWKCDGASEYVVYANKCNTKGHKYSFKKIAATTDTSYTIKKIAGKKLTKNTFYKVKVVALDADGDSLNESRIMYVATGGYKGKYGNTTKINAKKSTIDVKVDESTTVGIKTYKVYKNKKAATNHTAKVRYLSSDKYVATVDASGVVTGIKEGICKIYMQAPNGRWTTTQVVVLRNEESVAPKTINIDEKRATMAEYILPWDSSEMEHDGVERLPIIVGGKPGATYKCSITVGDDAELFYEDIGDAWVDANTTYKNKADLVFKLYDDWVADENSGFGSDTNSFLGGGLLIKGWKKNVTIDLNGFKIDRKLSGETITNGFVIKVDGLDDKKVYIKNGYITGGGNTNDGGGVLIYGEAEVFFDNVKVSGNVSGRDGGGVYFGSYATVNLEDTSIEGNYAENYGGGAYADYNRNGASINIREIKGVVTIQNNKGVNNRNNLTFEYSDGEKNNSPYIYNAQNLSEGSAVYVSSSQESSNERIIVYDDRYDSETHKYFYIDADEWKFVTVEYSTNIEDPYGDKYLGIVKNEAVNPKTVNIDEKREMMAGSILQWDSSQHEHYYFNDEIPSLGMKCSLMVGNEYILYKDIEEAWVDANTTYKNKDDVVLTLYDDWVADENEGFGTDTNAFLNGGLLVKGWENSVTIDLNGFKIDRNLSGETITNGFVIKVDGYRHSDVCIKNGYITGGGNTNDGGGILIYGGEEVFFNNMIITGNVSGRDGGGVYFGSYATVSLEDTTIEGNYAENFGGGAYADYNVGATDYNIKEIKGVVRIQNNKGVNNRNNLTLEYSDGNCTMCPKIHSEELSEGSSVYVSCSQEKSDEKIVIYDEDYNAKAHKYLYIDGNEWKFVTVDIRNIDFLAIVKNNG